MQFCVLGALVLSFALGSKAAVPVWGQCGGIRYNSDTTCEAGAIHEKWNDWYYQCRPETALTTTSPTPTSSSSSGSSPPPSSSTSHTTSGPTFVPVGTTLKPRIIILSDIAPADREPDDIQSFIHILASADMYEIEGIISTTGYNIGDNTSLKTYIFHDVIDQYEKDLPNLMKRSGQSGFQSDESSQNIGYWPSPVYLRSVVREGITGRGMDKVGNGQDTAGTNHIIDVLDQDDDRPVWVQLWGGGNTVAQAIWNVRHTRSSTQLDAWMSKLRVYAITDQDRHYPGEGLENSSQRWMRQTFSPDKFFYIWSYSSWGTYGSTIKNSYWSRYQSSIQGKANLGRMYPNWKYIVEGDSPSYLHSWPGLNDPNDPTQYGFGGRFARGTAEDGSTCWLDRSGDAQSRSNNAVRTTLPDQINDFISRLDWASRGSGNRNPRVIINNDAGYGPVVVPASAGRSVQLSASGSSDPDGNNISYSWSRDDGAGYSGSISISGANSQTATVQVPSGMSGSIHVVLRAVDNGSPPLATYRRAIIRV